MKTPLLSLMLGCLLLPQLHAEDSPSAPRLAGIVNLPDLKAVVLDISPSPSAPRSLIQREGQRDGKVATMRIKPESGSVELRIGGAKVQLTLRPPCDGNPTSIAGGGFMLENADISPVLSLLAEWKGRSLLIWPRLSAVSLSLQTALTNRTEAAQVLEKALAEKGIVTIPDGEKFLMIVPVSDAKTIRPRSAEIKASAGAGVRMELLPAGAINFPNADLNIAAQIYADLIARKLDQTQRLARPTCAINFQNLTPLSKEECVYALETLFRWQGVRLVSAGDGLAKVVPLPKPQ